MKVIFMGTPDFAVGTLKALHEAGHEVTLVVSQPDKPKGRKQELSPTPVKAAAEQLGLPVYQPSKIRAEESIEYLRNVEADVIVVAAFGQIIPRAILEMKKYGCINVHASLLPRYRGAAPIQWAVINGEKESGVTIMQMDEGLDTGDMLLKETVPLEEKETGGSLFDKLSRVGADLCVKALKELEKGTIVPEKQGESPTAYASMLTKEMGKIDWTKDAASIERLVRGLNPWPSAYTGWNGRTIKVWSAQVIAEESACAPDASLQAPVPGQVVRADKEGLAVCTGRGILQIKELQLEGKKRMDAASFLRGCPIKPGDVCGSRQAHSSK